MDERVWRKEATTNEKNNQDNEVFKRGKNDAVRGEWGYGQGSTSEERIKPSAQLQDEKAKGSRI